jgi:hypothetical protein
MPQKKLKNILVVKIFFLRAASVAAAAFVLSIENGRRAAGGHRGELQALHRLSHPGQHRVSGHVQKIHARAEGAGLS